MLDGTSQFDGVPSNFAPPIDDYNTMSDILIAHSTLPGYKSHRDTAEGSWFINCLCKVFMEHAHNTDVTTLLLKVSEKLIKIKSSIMTSQTPTFHNIHFKNCYLHPGIYEEEGEIKKFNECIP